jgi:L-seryl-tRNA(Ser) seleniumtransferase
MLLLRHHGILTVHFAAPPPGTAVLLYKFISPETHQRLGGADAAGRASESSRDRLDSLVRSTKEMTRIVQGDYYRSDEAHRPDSKTQLTEPSRADDGHCLD